MVAVPDRGTVRPAGELSLPLGATRGASVPESDSRRVDTRAPVPVAPARAPGPPATRSRTVWYGAATAVILVGATAAWLLRPHAEPPPQGRTDSPTTSASNRAKPYVATNPGTLRADASGADAAARTDAKSPAATDAAVPGRDPRTVEALPDRRPSPADPPAVARGQRETRGSDVPPRRDPQVTRDGGSPATGNGRNGPAAVSGGNSQSPEPARVTPQNQPLEATGPPVARDERADRAAIQDLVQQFADAYARQDEARLREIDPRFGRIEGRGLIRSVALTFSSISITFGPTGDTASLTAAGTLNHVWTTPGIPPTSSLPLAWKLRKTGTTWAVVP
jgi:hypothetical protein